MSKKHTKAMECHTKYANMRITNFLKMYLEFCEEHGYHPNKEEEIQKKYTRVLHTIEDRRKTGIETPKEIMILLDLIKQYSTEKIYKTKPEKPILGEFSASYVRKTIDEIFSKISTNTELLKSIEDMIRDIYIAPENKELNRKQKKLVDLIVSEFEIKKLNIMNSNIQKKQI